MIDRKRMSLCKTFPMLVAGPKLPRSSRFLMLLQCPAAPAVKTLLPLAALQTGPGQTTTPCCIVAFSIQHGPCYSFSLVYWFFSSISYRCIPSVLCTSSSNRVIPSASGRGTPSSCLLTPSASCTRDCGALSSASVLLASNSDFSMTPPAALKDSRLAERFSCFCR